MDGLLKSLTAIKCIDITEKKLFGGGFTAAELSRKAFDLKCKMANALF